MATPATKAQEEQFTRLREEYNALLKGEGNKFYYGEHPTPTSPRYVFRDKTCFSITEAIEYITEQLSALKRSTTKGTVHVANASTAGHDVELAQALMYDWHNDGYAVAPMPVDGRDHPYDKPCPACSETQS